MVALFTFYRSPSAMPMRMTDDVTAAYHRSTDHNHPIPIRCEDKRLLLLAEQPALHMPLAAGCEICVTFAVKLNDNYHKELFFFLSFTLNRRKMPPGLRPQNLNDIFQAAAAQTRQKLPELTSNQKVCQPADGMFCLIQTLPDSHPL